MEKGSILSMTGYGRYEYSENGVHVSVEMRGLNHRYLDISVKLPKGMFFLEPHIRAYVSDRVSRGKIDVFVQIRFEGVKGKKIYVNKELAVLIWEKLKDLAIDIGAPLPGIGFVIHKNDVFTIEEEVEEEELKDVVMKAVSGAVDRFLSFRQQEGERLKKDIVGRVAKIRSLVDKARTLADISVKETREKLIERLKSLEIEETRVAQEIAIMVDKMDITEEIVRLYAHIDAFIETVEAGSPCGRRLDFIIQEMIREANTLGVKAAIAELSLIAVDIKTEIEKIREQVQNIE